MNAADHIARAKETLTTDADPKYAIAHALVAIAELLTEHDRTEAAALAAKETDQ